MATAKSKRKRQSHCFVPGCRSGYNSNKGGVSIFSVPRDNTLLKLWTLAIRRGDRPLTDNCCVCELHFEPRFVERYYRVTIHGEEVLTPRDKPKLVKGAIPTVFPNLPGYRSKILEKYISKETEKTVPPLSKKIKDSKFSSNPSNVHSPIKHVKSLSYDKDLNYDNSFNHENGSLNQDDDSLSYTNDFANSENISESINSLNYDSSLDCNCSSLDCCSNSLDFYSYPKVLYNRSTPLEKLCAVTLPTKHWVLIRYEQTEDIVCFATWLSPENGIADKKVTVKLESHQRFLCTVHFRGTLVNQKVISCKNDLQCLLNEVNIIKNCSGAGGREEFPHVAIKGKVTIDRNVLRSTECVGNADDMEESCASCKHLRLLLLRQRAYLKNQGKAE